MPSNYPSPPPPSGVQASGSTGPFYNQNNENERGASPLPHDDQRVQSQPEARISGNDNHNNASANHQAFNSNAEKMEAMSSPHDYAPNPDPNQMTYAQQAAHGGEEGQPATPEGIPPQTSTARLAQGVLSISEPETQQQLIAAANEHHVQHQQSLQHPLQQPANSRRRNKNSRACDECRRKKIRCDSANEASTDVCTNCIKTGAICQFSRQPMKRGPNKGYIKGLADRVRSLENRSMPQGQMYLQQIQDDLDYRLPEQEDTLGEESFAGTPVALGKRKLHPTGDGSLEQNPAKRAVQAFMQAPTYNFHHSEMAQATADPTYDPFSDDNDLWQPDQIDVNKMGFNFYVQDGDELSLDSMLKENQANIQEYYGLVEPILPMLPRTFVRLRSLLAQCPVNIQNVFHMALKSFVHTLPTSNIRPSKDDSDSPKEMFIPDASAAVAIISTQSLIMMMLQKDNRGPGCFDGSHNPSKAQYLEMAIAKAVSFKLNSLEHDDSDEDGVDALDKIGYRVWWVLFILDRWHACSSMSPLRLPEKRTAPSPDDMKGFGQNTENLIRFSYTMGSLATVLQQNTPLMSLSPVAASIIAANLQGQIELTCDMAYYGPNQPPNFFRLVYWHIRLMLALLTPSTKPRDVIFVVSNLAELLNTSFTLISPLNHHIAAMCVMTLNQLSKLEETRDEAQRGIDEILDALAGNRGLWASEESEGWDQAIRKMALKTKGMSVGADGSATAAPGKKATTSTAGLQHLADAAIGENDGTKNQGQQSQEPEGSTFEPTSAIRVGYLVALAQEEFGSAS